MEVMHSCRCCLRCPADRDLTTPYTHLGSKEIYSDMLKECFDLHLTVSGDGSCGICSACVGRLRDASDFKLQVQRSQAELRARLQGALRVKEEEPEVEPETEDGDGSSEEPASDEEPSFKQETLDTDETDAVLGSEMAAGAEAGRVSDEEPRVEAGMAAADETDDEMSREEPPVKAEMMDEDGTDEVLGSEMADGDGTSDEDDPILLLLDSCAVSQLAMTCSVRLERLRGDEAPHASHTSLATLHESRRASRMKETHDNTGTAGLRAEEAYTCHTFLGHKRRARTRKEPKKQKSSQKTFSDSEISDNDDSSDASLTSSSLTHISISGSNEIFLNEYDEFPPPATSESIPNANNLLPDPANENSYNSTYMSNATDVFESLPDAFQSATYIFNTTDTEEAPLETIEPSSKANEHLPSADHDLKIENQCLDGPHEVALNCCEETNIAEKENVSLRKCSSEDHKEEENEIDNKNVAEEDILGDKREIGKRIRERDFCFYCETFILNFARHMVRNHPAEPEVQLAFSYPKNSFDRKKIINDLRKKGNYVSNSQNSFKPVKKCRYSDKTDYLPCSKCLGFYAKRTLWRHVKTCDKTIPTNNAQSQAQNFLVRYVKVDKNLKETIFPRLRPDKISLVAKKDKLICMFGAQYLKTHSEKHFATVVTRKMRELAKLLIEATKLKPNINNLEQILKPEYYDTLVHATKMVARFNEVTQQFGAPTYAMNIATSIKQCCNIALLQSCKTEASVDTASVQADLKTLSKLIEDNWKFDISSQAADDLNSKKLNKTTIVPLAADLKLFKDYLCAISKQSSDNLTTENINIQAFNNLVESTYCRTLLLNRRRPGELQRLKLNDYNGHGNDSNKYEELDKVLSPTEKCLVDNLKIIVIRGKSGRGVPVLFSTEIQYDIKKMLSMRDMHIGSDNSLLFVKAGGIAVCGYKILEKYAKVCGAKNYRALTSTRLRKHLATMTQLFTMTDTELEQLATFMGHTLSVHKNNYGLPNDVYQTAKISKLLLLMEDGKADMYRGKALDEIDLNLDEEIKGIEIENHEVTGFELEEGKGDESQNADVSIPKPSPLLNVTHKTSAKKKRTLVPWTDEQKNVVTKYFKEHIKHKKPPKRAECDELKNKYPTLLDNKNWLKIKVYIQNTYSKQ